MRYIATTFLLLIAISAFAQPTTDSPRQLYRAFAPKINDLVHTRLDVRFDYKKSYLYGKEWVTLRPHFYPTDSLQLDAKGMDIHRVAVGGPTAAVPLKYSYDGKSLNIRLNRAYSHKETYTVFI